MIEKRWIYKPQPNPATVDELVGSINLVPELATLLAQRGVASFDEAKAFFRPDLAHFHNPFLMADMEKAVNR